MRLLEGKKRKKKMKKRKTYNSSIIFDQLLDRVQQDVRTITDVGSIITIIIIYEQVISFSPSNRRFFDILIFNILIFFLIIISRKIRRGELNDVYPSIRVQQDVRTIIIRLLLLLFMNKS